MGLLHSGPGNDTPLRRPPAVSEAKLRRLFREEAGGFSPHLLLVNGLPRVIPAGVGGRIRAALYRRLGLRVGPGTLVAGALAFGPAKRFHRNVRIGARCFINSHVYIDAAAAVTLGDGVSLGHHVVIITTSHVVGPPEFRAGPLEPKPVVIGDGAWVAAGVTLLPGVTVGRGAVVAAGAVVTGDVAANTLVGGVPAKLIRALDSGPGAK